MGFATSLLITLLLLAVLILIHEFGHFIVAKAVGVRVDEFSLGLFGPKLASWRRGETEYTVRLFVVLGGFVRMAGMSPEEPDYDTPRGFNKQPLWARAAVLAAGPVMNFLMAALLFAILLGSFNLDRAQQNPVQIGQIFAGQPAAAAGFQVGDEVQAINGRRIRTWTDLQVAIQGAKGQPLTFDLRRGPARTPVQLTVTPVASEQDPTVGIIGVGPVVVSGRLSPGAAIVTGVTHTWEVLVLQLRGLGMMITRHAAADLIGPVGMTKQVQMALGLGLAQLLQLAGFLSATVGLMNLLPLPALDGGRLAFLVVEALRGKPVDPNHENLVHLVGFALLILLGLFVTYKDILHLTGPS